MIRCGSCGLAVTAEHKYKPSGRHYIYYHCTKRRLGPRCAESSLEVRSLEDQIEQFVRSLAIDPAIEAWLLDETTRDAATLRQQEEARRQSLEKSFKSVEEQLAELTGLRIRNLLTDQEYLLRRGEFQKECIRLRERIASEDHGSSGFEPVSELISFSNRAADWFLAGDDQTKRLILETVGSNPTLTKKILRFQAKKPFASVRKTPDLYTVLGVGDDVRTLRGNFAGLAKTILDYAQTEEGQHVFHNIRALRNRFEPEVVAKERALKKPRRAKAATGVCRVRATDASWQMPLQ
jgi:hypothetical protein